MANQDWLVEKVKKVNQARQVHSVNREDGDWMESKEDPERMDKFF